MKSKKISVITLLFVFLLNISVFAEYKKQTGIWYGNLTRNTAPLPGAVSVTPPQWKFEFDGEEFIILDTFEKDGKMNFFIMTESLYGNHVFSTATKEPYGWFEPEDENNIAYWLNNDFWNNGNGSKALSEEMKKYIIKNSWVTEPLRDDAGTGHVPDGYKSTALAPVANCKLALLADWEWKEYIGKIGYPGGTWYFRTVRTVDIKNTTSNILCGLNALGYNSTVAATGTPRGIRPVFMLSSDFFYNNKLSEAGSEVVKLIDSYCNPELYTEEERRAVFGWPDAVIDEISGNAVVGQEVEVKYTYYGTFEEEGTEFRWLRSDNASSGFTEIPGANKQTYKITDGDSDKYIKAEVLPKSKSVMAKEGYRSESYAIGPVFGTAKVAQAIDELRKEPAETVISVLEKYNGVFEVNTDLSYLPDEVKSNAEAIFANADFDTIEEVRREYDRAVALASLNANDDVSLTPDYICDELHLDLSRFDELKDKDEVYEAVTGKNYTEFRKFEKDFYETVCVLDVKSSDRNNIKDVLKAYVNTFSTNISQLTEYRLGLVGSEILKGTYKNFAELDEAVSEAFRKALDVEDVEDTPMISDNIPERDENRDGGKGFVPVIPKNTLAYEAMRGNYTDLERAEWARESIEMLTKKGIVSGYGDGTFCPNATLTREEFVKIVVSAFYPDAQGFKAAGFTDVGSDKWYSMYINIAFEKGIINGVSDTVFGIGQNITREDMAVIICRAADKNSDNSLISFTDSNEISEYAKTAVSALVSGGFISGFEDGSFGPKQPATRAMAAKIIYEIIK